MLACPQCHREITGNRALLFFVMSGKARCEHCGVLSKLSLGSAVLTSCLLGIAMYWPLITILQAGGSIARHHFYLATAIAISATWLVIVLACSRWLILTPIVGRVWFGNWRNVLVLNALVLAGVLLMDAYLPVRNALQL